MSDRSNMAKAAVAGGLLVALVVLFFVLQGGDDSDRKSKRGGGAASSRAVETGPKGEPAPTPKGKPAPKGKPSRGKPAKPVRSGNTIKVRNGKPVGGVFPLVYAKGEQIRFSVSSDSAEEVHVHGYDLTEKVAAGGRVSFSFEADKEGFFEIELEESHTQIAELEVTPG